MRRVTILTNFGRKKRRYTFPREEKNAFVLYKSERGVATTHAAITSTNTNGNNVKTKLEKRDDDIILQKSTCSAIPSPLSDYYQYNTSDLIKVLNVYIKSKSDNIELLRSVSTNLLLNKEKLRYGEIVTLLKQFSMIKCKNYFLFCYFKDVLSENIHLITCDDLVDIYFSFTNLNYFHHNFFFLIEKRIFHNFHLLNLKKIVCLIQCFNKKKIISKNYLTILLYSISKNINEFDTFQLSVLFVFFKNFNINNSILINSLIHNFNQHVNLGSESKQLAIFYNFLSYVGKKCHRNYHYFAKEKELIGLIKNFALRYEEQWEGGPNGPGRAMGREDPTGVYGDTVTDSVGEVVAVSNGDASTHAGGIIQRRLSILENNFLTESDELQTLREHTNALKKNSYNVNVVYSIKNALKNVETITRKKLKSMPIESLCLISSSIGNIDKNKFLLEKVAEEVGKQSTKLTPLLVSFLMLSFSKASHKHGSLIYYSLQFFYKYHSFFSVNEVGLLCKALHNFSLKENEFLDVLNGLMLNVLSEGSSGDNLVDSNPRGDHFNYNADDGSSSGKQVEKLFFQIEKSIDKSIEQMNYEDQFTNLRSVHMEEEGKSTKDEKERVGDRENKRMYSDFVNFSFIDYENIKRNNYYPNNLYNIKMSNKIYINNVIYILEYYAFNLVNIPDILDRFCDFFLKRNINYILYSRIFYAFYLLQYRGSKVYQMIDKFNECQPLYQVMYKERHMEKLLGSLIYFYENKTEENKMENIYFYVLSKSYFSFIFNFSKYILTFLFIKNSNYVLHKFLVHIGEISLERDDCIYLHKPNRLY
ncbi:conserved Plasmodium protein, unknown function [Plasmodium knowlesi strain H]|uniref:Uncharacterized protein n=3 Tax=Plasmodium knowlesi TaxID=5850 RepID=A0A5K1V4K7_PLAKH|nr:heptatricopeptide repeat-containing protein, putative [Plasmodium knowlesi strain H]OTN64360.1 Uncharacterized protein PKNOH_S130168800 [Plasmodium knowlesi]CAA9988856.1 heptatricopeptide repeat-containing protein, putative [Plasmodium knowlesi strain H]SBO24686.1 conserved Plasmodium protein, unknown function [Plasmodium knowlesi strain H]SBO27965.1 conserved Plasmodium protein, unknown function [Plasmodium knowlesi strain H]VVS78330.1 heptatricopeptide repeat-containing protein, putative |eukprot:XP_002261202.1 hypothetical protein, conserved in Plasmodium species [Plasmodium knowlesi strain H]